MKQPPGFVAQGGIEKVCWNVFSPSCYKMGYSIKPHVLIHPLKMG